MSNLSHRSQDTVSLITTVTDNTNVIFFKPDEDDSSSMLEDPLCRWSSLDYSVSQANPKRIEAEQGLYSPGSGEVCNKHIKLSSSAVLNHPYYNFHSIADPGIVSALKDPLSEDNQWPADGGEQLYHKLCQESNTCPVSLFYKNLKNEEINLSYYCVNSVGIRRMAKALQFNKHVKRWNLTENFLDLEACYHLGEMLAYNRTLQELILTGCRIEETGLIRLIRHLHENKSLVTLGLSRNQLGDNGGALLAKEITRGSTVQRLCLSKNELGMKTAIALDDTLTYAINYITHLDLSWNNFTHVPTTAELLKHIAFSKVLEELNLSWNSLEGEKISKALSFILLIPTLRIFDLSNNRLQDKDVQTIIKLLPHAKRLNTFDLSFNPLSPDGALLVLKKMLRESVKVQNLFLEQICVCKEFLECLERVQKMTSRKNFFIKHGELVRNWTIQGSDPRELILRRAKHLGNRRRHGVDVPLYFLKLSLEFPDYIDVKDLIHRLHRDHVPLDDDLIYEMAVIFPGPKKYKSILVDLKPVKEFIRRLWPEKTLAEASVMHIKHIKYTKSKPHIVKRVKAKEIKKVKGN